MPDEFKLQIYITRHGETWGNLAFSEGRNQNPETESEKHDPELTPWGLKQAQLLGRRLSLKRFDAIFSSPLIRAVSTAYETSIRQPEGAVSIELLPDLMETGTPWEYEGYPLSEINRRYPSVESTNLIRNKAVDWIKLEAQDEREAYMRRAEHCITYFRSRFQNGESIFVVAHGGFNTYLTRAALGLNNTNDFNFCQENTGLTKIKYFLND
ncbi:MAG: histidine phosphatase family protein, partial [Eubacteriales bacterium]